MKTHAPITFLSGNNKQLIHGFTLLELLVIVSLIGVVALSFFSIFIFGNTQAVTAERRVKVQNDLSLAIDHMAKHIAMAVGNEQLYGAGTTIVLNPGTMLSAYIDAGTPPNGIRDSGPPDYWIAYRRSAGAAIDYCARCSNSACGSCTSGWETLTNANRILSVGGFNITKPGGSGMLNQNYIDVTLIGRYKADSAASSENPQVEMKNRIALPMVSTH